MVQMKKTSLENRQITIRKVADQVDILFGSNQAIVFNVLDIKRLSAKFVPKLWLKTTSRTYRSAIVQWSQQRPNQARTVIMTAAWRVETYNNSKSLIKCEIFWWQCIIGSCHMVVESMKNTMRHLREAIRRKSPKWW